MFENIIDNLFTSCASYGSEQASTQPRGKMHFDFQRWWVLQHAIRGAAAGVVMAERLRGKNGADSEKYGIDFWHESAVMVAATCERYPKRVFEVAWLCRNDTARFWLSIQQTLKTLYERCLPKRKAIQFSAEARSSGEFIINLPVCVWQLNCSRDRN